MARICSEGHGTPQPSGGGRFWTLLFARWAVPDSRRAHSTPMAMRHGIHGSTDHSDVAASLCSLAQVYELRVDWMIQRCCVTSRWGCGSKDHRRDTNQPSPIECVLR